MLLLFIVKNYKPEKHYSNADTDKLKIYSDNKDKSGVYR